MALFHPASLGTAVYTSYGLVGIKRTDPNVALDVYGSIEYTGSITDVSDDRLKENLRPIDSALEKIQAIDGVYFNMIETPGQREIGVTAQNVQKVLPEAVKVVDPKKGYLGVSYPSLVPVLIEAVKTQQKEISQMEARYKVRLQELEARYQAEKERQAAETEALRRMVLEMKK